MNSATGLLYLEEGLRHMTGAYHPECPARLPAIEAALEAAGVVCPALACGAATREDLLRNHTQAHLDTVEHHCRTGLRHPDPDTVMGPGSWDAALMAAGAGIAACRAVIEGRFRNVFCAVRPPGHHAEADRAMGFCLFNNVAVAARWLRAEAGLHRVAIFDWDVHHGNGTQHSFYDDDTVYYVSIHESPLYPGTGLVTERGKHGTNLNLPMPPGTGPEAWLDAVQHHVVPALRQYQPEFLLISAGYDAHRSDPLASQLLEAETFGSMFSMLRGIAGDRAVALLEGGYDLDALGASAVATIRAMQTAG